MSRNKSSERTQSVCRFWPAILAAVVALGLLVPGLAQAQTLTGTFVGKGTGRQVTFQHQGKAQNDWAGVLRLKLDNGPEIPVFCIQIEVRVRSGDRYRSDGAVLALPNGCQIRYLLDKYPASSAKSADEAAARQLAIWVFSDGVDPSTIEDAGIRDRTIALVNEARQGPCPTRRTEAPDLTLAPPNANTAAGQTVAYTVQASAEDAGHPATVSVAGPAVLTDAGGASTGGQQQQVTLDAQGQAHFWVMGTGAGTITVRVDLPYQLGAGTVFSHLDNGPPTQRLVMAENRSLTASATGQLSVSGGQQPTPTAPAQPAPQPSPTVGQAPQPPPTAEQATAVPTQQAPAPTAPPPPPTRKPSHRTATPTPPEQPSATVISETQATTAPTAAGAPPADTTATPIVAPEAGGQAPPIDQAAAAQTATAQAIAAQAAAGQAATAAPAGGAAQPRPRSLPNTGAADTPVAWLLALGGALLVLGGWLSRRRSVR